MSSLNFDKLLRSLFILSTSFLPTNSCEDRDFRSSFILCESNDCNCPILFCCPPSVLLHSPSMFLNRSLSRDSFAASNPSGRGNVRLLSANPPDNSQHRSRIG